MSIAETGSAVGALVAFLLFYVSCLALTWFGYVGPKGILRDVEGKRAAPSAGEASVSPG